MADDNSTSAVFSLAKLAYNACDEYQRSRYCETQAPRIHLYECCEMLFEVMALNTNSGQFDEHGDRRFMCSKVCSNDCNERYLHLCKEAALNGHIDCLRMAHEMGFQWDFMAPLMASIGGHLDCLVYAHENGCHWDYKTCIYAGSLECLKYARDHGCEWNATVSTDTLRRAVINGRIECVRYLRENGGEWDPNTFLVIVEKGYLDILVYALEDGCPASLERACNVAARFGQLECLAYLHNHGAPWDSSTCTSAVIGGQIDCLSYALSNGCPANENACFAAVMQGRLECLVYLHNHGVPWKKDICEVAVRYGHIDCLRYMIRAGCEFNRLLCMGLALRFKRADCYIYLRDMSSD